MAEAVGVPAQERARAAVVFEHLAVVGVGDRDGGGAVDGAGLAAALGVEGVGGGVAGGLKALDPAIALFSPDDFDALLICRDTVWWCPRADTTALE